MKKFNYKKIDFCKKIKLPEIKYPKRFVPGLKKLKGHLREGIFKKPNFYEHGDIPIGKLPPDLDLRYSFFIFVAEINEVIANLNIVLSDFYDLKENPSSFSQNSKERVYLLMRTFFYEYFRVKELFFIFTKNLSRQGFIARNDLKSIREDFSKNFENGINIRNKLVHSRLSWVGKENLDLIVTTASNEIGYVITEKATGREVTIKEALER